MVRAGVAWDLGIWWHDPREGTVNPLHGTATVPSHHAESQLDCCLLPQDSGAVTPEPITLEAPKWLQAVNCSSMICLRFMLF